MTVLAKKAWTEHPVTTDYDISSKVFWSKTFDEREATFAKLRKEAPVSFHPSIEVPVTHEEKGFWAITKAEDLAEAARMNDVFLSGYGLHVDPYPWDGSTASFFHTQDGELHQKNRAMVSSAFTPKQVGRLVDEIHATAESIVDDLVGAGDVDFVTACAERLPGIIGARLIGVPQEELDEFMRASNRLIGKADPELGNPEDPIKAFKEARAYVMDMGRRLAAHRRKNPADDLITNLVQVEENGQGLSDDDIGGFAYLMTIAANDTTKQTTTLSLMALDAHPDQKRWLMEDFDGRIGTATSEFLRFASPVIHHARTAARDVEFRGHQISRGDKLALFYCSANRDEDRFADPMKFDLSRAPNPHVAFGGGGVHFCLGNRFATTMLQAIFGQLLRRTEITITGEPEYLVSNLIRGIRHLPVHIASA
jgi:cytochrome P450